MKLKHNVELHGFGREDLMIKKIGLIENDTKILYQGKLSDVTNEQAIMWVDIKLVRKRHGSEVFHFDYVMGEFNIETALESLKSATTSKFIIITKTQ